MIYLQVIMILCGIVACGITLWCIGVDITISFVNIILETKGINIRFNRNKFEVEYVGNCNLVVENEMLKQTIRTAYAYIKDYKKDSDLATHSKRLLANAMYEFDGKYPGKEG